MQKFFMQNLKKVITKSTKKTLSNTSIRAIAFSFLFLISGIGGSLLIQSVAATPNSAAPLAANIAAATPLSQAEANWEFPNGNAFNQDYNPQHQINASVANYLGLAWLYPLPSMPNALIPASAFGAPGVGMQVLIVNGTAFADTNFDTVIAFNVANGNVLWTYNTPLTVNESIPGAGGICFGGACGGFLVMHHHDGNEWFTTANMGPAIKGPTLWYIAADRKVFALNALTGKPELNFSSYTGRNMVPGNGKGTTYHSVGASDIIIDQKRGIVVTSMDAEISADNGRGFFAGWNLNVNPPTLAWLSFTTPPQPGGNVPLDPAWDIHQIANISKEATTFFPGKGATNGYTTAAELKGGVMMNTNDAIVINWKTMSPTQLNATLYNDWGQVNQSPQCQAITGGGSTGSTGAAWGGPWVMGSGPTDGIAYVGTNNKDPFVGPCNPGPNLWSASVFALNTTNGHWIWAFQTTTHDVWDYDCSWWQATGNVTISGVITPVIFKTCKNGFLYELNALTGHLIWAWSPPTNIIPRCAICWPMDPTNKTQTSIDFPTALNTFKTQPTTGAQPPFLQFPSELAGFEDEQSFNPSSQTLFVASHIVPYYMFYDGLNSSTYFTYTGEHGTPINTGTCANCAASNNNSTIWSIDAVTGNINWHYLIPLQGFRGAVTLTGGMVLSTLSSGDLLMLNQKDGSLVRDYYVGAPMDVAASVGAAANGQVYIVMPVGTCSAEAVVTCPGTTPGNIVALTLTTPPPPAPIATTVTSVSTTTAVSVSTTTAAGQVTTITTTAPGGGVTTITTTLPGGATTITSTTTGGGVDPTTLYGVAAVAVIFIIATGFLAVRGRKPSP
jgi:glucose dehydrogenase